MRQYQGLRVEIKPIVSGEALKKYQNDHFIAPGNVSSLTCSRLVQEAPGIYTSRGHPHS